MWGDLETVGPTVAAIAGLSFLGWWIALHRALGIARERRRLRRGFATDGDGGIVDGLRRRLAATAPPGPAALDAWLLEERARVGTSLGAVATIAAICPLLGLLGTLLGLIDTFGELSGSVVRSASLGRGVARALTTTEAGLLAALPLIMLQGVVESRSEVFFRELERVFGGGEPAP